MPPMPSPTKVRLYFDAALPIPGFAPVTVVT